MLESMYLTLIAASFALYALAFLTDKPIAKVALFGTCALLFGALAVSSSAVEIKNCQDLLLNSTIDGNTTYYERDSSCSREAFFYEGEMWLFTGLSLFSAVMVFIVSFLAAGEGVRGVFGRGGNP